jgi:hypothetical protein
MTRALLLALLLNVSTPLQPGVMVCPFEPQIPFVCIPWIRAQAAAHQKV